MKGKNSGIQKRILDQNPLAFFILCGCYNLNLVLCYVTKSSVRSVTYLMSQGNCILYLLPQILTDQVKSFTLKRLSDMC
jgi:hypothetical protein